MVCREETNELYGTSRTRFSDMFENFNCAMASAFIMPLCVERKRVDTVSWHNIGARGQENWGGGGGSIHEVLHGLSLIHPSGEMLPTGFPLPVTNILEVFLT